MTAATWKDQPRALRDGVLLVAASMTFRDSSSNALAAIYADPRRELLLPNPLLSDAGGRFPPVFVDPDTGYAATLVDADGELVWDEDPFSVFPDSETGIPLDDTGAAMPMCVLTFWRADTTILAAIYDDGTLTSELDNPLTADGAGQFPTIYIDDEIAYRIRLENAAGELVYDVSDYQQLPQTVAPSPPVLSGVLDGADGELSWTAATAGTFAIDEYQLFRSVDSGPFVLLATIPVADPRAYTDAGLTPDVVYQYFVIAIDIEDNESAPSNIVQLEPLQDFTSMVVALGFGSDAVMSSPDGINWTVRTTSFSQWQGVCYSQDLHLFVAVANLVGAKVMTSPDGITWTDRSAPLYANGVAWSPSLALFAAVGSSGNIMTSPDGINWTVRTAPASLEYVCIVWAEEIGLFLAGSTSGPTFITVSSNGIAWSLATSASGSGAEPYALTWSGSRACSANRGEIKIIYSDDGLVWTLVPTGGPSGTTDIAYGAGLFVLVAGAANVLTSPDGITWTSRTPAAVINWEGICFSNTLGLFIATAGDGVGARVMTSPDGINWTLRSSPDTRQWLTVVSGLVAT